MPTKLEQGDLSQALHGGHGDFPRIVMAPASVEDCLYQTVHAFNLAEKYQMPVVFLSDQSLSHRTEALEMPDAGLLEGADRERPRNGDLDSYVRFRLTESGVSPMALPGADADGMHVAPGLEHDESGRPTAEPAVHEAMTQKRFRKLAAVQSELAPVPRYGSANPRVGIIGWGSTEGAIREAVERATAAGYDVAALHPRVLSPLPERELGDFSDSVEHVIVPEANYQGQWAHHLAATFGFKPVRTSDLSVALSLALTEERVHLGVFYHDESRHPFEERSRELAGQVTDFDMREYLSRFA